MEAYDTGLVSAAKRQDLDSTAPQGGREPEKPSPLVGEGWVGGRGETTARGMPGSFATPGLQATGLTLRPVAIASEWSKFDMTLSVLETAEGLNATLEYSLDLFDDATAERLLG